MLHAARNVGLRTIGKGEVLPVPIIGAPPVTSADQVPRTRVSVTVWRVGFGAAVVGLSVPNEPDKEAAEKMAGITWFEAILLWGIKPRMSD